MRQYVQVTGLGLPQFDDAVDKMRLIQELYETSNPAHTVKDVRFTPYEGHRTLESSARYFTDRYLIPDEKNIAFGRLVDPEGVLSKLKPDSFIHGPDNTVEYCTLFALGEDGRHKYVVVCSSMDRALGTDSPVHAGTSHATHDYSRRGTSSRLLLRA